VSWVSARCPPHVWIGVCVSYVVTRSESHICYYLHYVVYCDRLGLRCLLVLRQSVADNFVEAMM
jgi:hypothetical protein